MYDVDFCILRKQEQKGKKTEKKRERNPSSNYKEIKRNTRFSHNLENDGVRIRFAYEWSTFRMNFISGLNHGSMNDYVFFLLLLLPHICGKNGLKFNQSWNWNRKFIIIITWKILKVLNILPLPYFNAINLCVWFFVFYFGEVQIKWSPKQLKREHISDYKMQSNDHNPLKVHLMQNKVLCRKVNGKTKNWKVESEREGQSKRKI